MFRRILPLVVVVCLLVACLVFPASAEIIDPSSYGDYVVDGDIITYNITRQYDLFWWRRLHNGALGETASGASFDYVSQMRWVDNDMIYLYPFGYDDDTAGSNFVSLDSYPLGADISFNADFEIRVQDATQTFTVQLTYYWSFYDEDFNSLGDYSYSYSIQTGGVRYDQSISRSFSTTNAKAKYFGLYFRWELDNVADESDDTVVHVEADTFTLSASFPVDKVQQMIEQGKLTNKQLDQIDQALKDNGQKLDDIMNTPVAPNNPNGSGTVNDYGELEDQIMNDMSSNLSGAEGFLNSATKIISKYGMALLAVSHLFGIFWRFPFFSELVLVAFAFGMFATLLGVAVEAIASHSYKPKYWNGKTTKSNPKYKGKFEKGGR